MKKVMVIQTIAIFWGVNKYFINGENMYSIINEGIYQSSKVDPNQ